MTTDKLAGNSRPRSIDFVAELPRNPSAKVLKRVLREPYWHDETQRVSKRWEILNAQSQER
jgi:acyl-CoA synthetase (AMP-forming)/AMP-acid ligase II